MQGGESQLRWFPTVPISTKQVHSRVLVITYGPVETLPICPTFAHFLNQIFDEMQVWTGLPTMLKVVKNVGNLLGACQNKFKFVQSLTQHCCNILFFPKNAKMLHHDGAVWTVCPTFAELKHAHIVVFCLLEGDLLLVTNFRATNA